MVILFFAMGVTTFYLGLDSFLTGLSNARKRGVVIERDAKQAIGFFVLSLVSFLVVVSLLEV